MKPRNMVIRDEAPLRDYFAVAEEQTIKQLVGHATGRVLDLGCGRGRLMQHLSADYAVGVDWNQDDLKDAARAYPAARYIRGNATKLPFPGATFDSIVAIGLMEHMHDLGPIVEEARRVLRPGGRLTFTCWAYRPWTFWPWLGLRRGAAGHRKQDVHDLLAAYGFRTIETVGLLFVPRRIIWGIARHTPRGFAGASLQVLAHLEHHLSRSHLGTRTSWEFAMTAVRS